VPWKCPACETQIRHDGDRPKPDTIYRCQVCRLELQLDDITKKLTVAPLPDTDQKPPKTPKTPKTRRTSR
jgi:hypothetical protein